MKIILGIFLALLTGCGNAADTPANVACLITFSSLDACEYQGIKVAVLTETLASDEKKLSSLRVQQKGKNYLLNISPDTTMLDGDKGYVLFDDVNFDGTPDLAISTSFGVANQYLDYWIYDEAKDAYRYVGNHTRFIIDAKAKKLTNEQKINAVNYKTNTFIWTENNLKKIE